MILLVSCKKDRTCTCTFTPISTTMNGVAQANTDPYKDETKLSKVTKRAAACSSSGERSWGYPLSLSSGSVVNIVIVEQVVCKLN